jgi:hypothetical protein
MVQRCSTCRCVLRFRPARCEESTCPLELQRDFIRGAQERGDWSYYKHWMSAYGRYTVWGISYACPGCDSIGTQYEPRYSEAEAEALVVAQNAAADEAERQGEPSGWREVVWQRTEWAARNLTDLFLSRFPQWESCARPFPAGPSDPEMETFEYVLVLDLPSEHPRLTDPLQISVQATETLIVWGDWHTHINAHDNDPTDRKHLMLTIDMIQEIVEEQIIIGSLLRGNDVVAGGSVSIHEELPRRYTHPDSLPPSRSGRVDCVMVRSWRGTRDRQVYPRSAG